MKAIIRTRVTDETRLALLEETILSARAASIQGITVVDDQSPLMVEVRLLCYKHGCTYLLTNGEPGPSNALYWALKIDSGDDLHLCDNVALAVTNWHDLPDPCDWGVISYFSLLDRNPGAGWWKHPAIDFTEPLALRVHPEVRARYLEGWDVLKDLLESTWELRDGELLRFALVLPKKEVWNTGWDFAQRTGPGDGASKSKYFIAERR